MSKIVVGNVCAIWTKGQMFYVYEDNNKEEKKMFSLFDWFLFSVI